MQVKQFIKNRVANVLVRRNVGPAAEFVDVPFVEIMLDRDVKAAGYMKREAAGRGKRSALHP